MAENKESSKALSVKEAEDEQALVADPPAVSDGDKTEAQEAKGEGGDGGTTTEESKPLPITAPASAPDPAPSTEEVTASSPPAPPAMDPSEAPEEAVKEDKQTEEDAEKKDGVKEDGEGETPAEVDEMAVAIVQEEDVAKEEEDKDKVAVGADGKGTAEPDAAEAPVGEGAEEQSVEAAPSRESVETAGDTGQEQEQEPEPMEGIETPAGEQKAPVETSEMEQGPGVTPLEELAPGEEEDEDEEEEVVMMEVENKENISDDVTVSSADSGEKAEMEKMETEGDQCYCGGGRMFEDVELQCNQCLKWFHKACIKTVNVGFALPYMTTYTFCCKICNVSKTETFSRKVANFRELCHCTLANLQAKQPADGCEKTLFSKELDLIPFIDSHWEQLTPMPRRTTTTWHATIVKAMMKDDDVFVCKEKPDDPEESEENYPLFGLLDQDLSKISPYTDLKLGSSLKLDSSQRLAASLNSSNGSSILSSSQRVSRSAKRKGVESNQGMTSSKRTRGEIPASQKLPPHGYPLEHPFNKDGYRYILTEPDPHAPSSAFEEDQWIGKPIPAHLYRMALSRDVMLALHDRAPQLKISEDRLSVTGDRGYCMVRATHGISRGCWYFEVTVNQLAEGSATRMGWSQPLGNLQAPLGYDKFAYSWRSRKGTRFHESRGKKYSAAYGEGDTLGFFIQLPEKTAKDHLIPPTYKDRALIKFKSHLYFEEKDQTSEAEKNLQTTQGTKIIFFKNGENLGVAYEDIYEGTYYPAISLYKQSTVTVNFGPDFRHPPSDLPAFKPISDLAYVSAVEQTLSDILFLVEHEKDYELAAKGILIDI